MDPIPFKATFALNSAGALSSTDSTVFVLRQIAVAALPLDQWRFCPA